MPNSKFPPGPPERFLIGQPPLMLAKDPLGTISRLAAEHGDIVHYRVFKFHIYLLNHPSYIEEVLVNRYQNFEKGRGLQGNRRLFGNGLLTSEGDFWRRQRRLSQPAFHRERVASYGEIMVRHTNRMLANWKDGERRDIHHEMMQVTLAIVAEALFHTEISGVAREIGSALEDIAAYNRTGQMLLPIVRSMPTPRLLRYRRAIHRLDKIVYRIIHERRASKRDEGDLLSMLLAAQDEDGSHMTDQQLRDESITLLLAGHETTAVALSWLWDLLSRNPDVEAKLLAELSSVLKGADPQVTDLPRLPYCEAVIKEAMRLYPPAWIIARTSREEFEIAGYRIPAGSGILISQWVMHRDARFWAAAAEFRPERWLDGSTRAIPKLVYFPFGAGPRICIGSSFAMTEAALLLGTIAQRFHFDLADNANVEPMPAITLRPGLGIPVTLHRR